MISIITVFKIRNSTTSSAVAIYFHCVIFILISVILCFLEESYIRAGSATLTHSPGPYRPILLCKGSRKKCFREGSPFHVGGLTGHVVSDVDLKRRSQPLHLSPENLPALFWHPDGAMHVHFAPAWTCGTYCGGKERGGVVLILRTGSDTGSLRHTQPRHLSPRAWRALPQEGF